MVYKHEHVGELTIDRAQGTEYCEECDPVLAREKFARTREALRVYDEGKPARAKWWDELVNDIPSLEAAEAEDAKAAELVHLAFYEDTKQFNSLEQCKLVHPNDPWLRAVVGADTGSVS